MDLKGELAKRALAIAQKIRKAGHTAFFAGGCVRDALMKKDPSDFDIATTATPDQIEKLFPKTVAVGKQFGVMLVVDGEHHFEVATFRTDGGYQDGRHPQNVSFSVPEHDAQRRDFTVNGMFYDPFDKKVIDYVGGQQDLKKKTIRAIGEPSRRFDEDKLRLLRCVRFASTLGFDIEEATWKSLRERAHLISQVSAERIRDEIVKIFTRPGAAKGLDLLSSSGLLQVVLPEIEKMKGVEQQPDWHPEGDVYVHTRLLLEKLDKPSLVLALGALFHDIGKPKTFDDKSGKITFYEHEHEGARMTEDVMKRLRFSNEEIEHVSEAVANHMKFGHVQQMREGKLKRFVMRDHFQDELELHRIDCLSSHGKLDNYEFLLAKLKEFAAEDLKPRPFLNGHDLIEMGMKPGPDMKTLLEEAYDAQLEKTLTTREEALKWAKKRLK